MLRLITENGRIEIQNEALEMRLLEKHITAQAEAKAAQEMLSVSYRVDGEPNADLPFGGLLTTRLQISERAARDLITDGRLAYSCVGAKKGYRVSERDVRKFEAEQTQAAA